MVKIDLKGCNVYVGWRLNYISTPTIKELRTLCDELKKHKLTFWVEKGFHSYLIYPRKTIVAYSNKESMRIG